MVLLQTALIQFGAFIAVSFFFYPLFQKTTNLMFLTWENRNDLDPKTFRRIMIYIPVGVLIAFFIVNLIAYWLSNLISY